MILLAPLLALTLAACQTTAGPGGYRAIGTEPFWDLTIGRDLVFTDRGNDLRVAEPAPRVRRGVGGETWQGRRLLVNIVHSRCSDGMSDRVYPDTATVTVDGRIFRGCGADVAFFRMKPAP